MRSPSPRRGRWTRRACPRRLRKRSIRSRSEGGGRWSFIDGRFDRPGIRMAVHRLTGGSADGAGTPRRAEADGASLIIAAPGKALTAEVRSDEGVVQGTSLATIYHPRGTLWAYGRMEGVGFVMDAELERA